MNQNVRVVARIRPQLLSEQQSQECLSFRNSKIVLHNQILNQYYFNDVVGPEQSQQVVYNKVGLVEVQKMFQGHNSTIFIMGSHNSGKSYTLIGKQEAMNRGIIPQAFEHIKQRIITQPQNKFLLQISCIGCRRNAIYDLLSPHKSELFMNQNLSSQAVVDNLSRKTIKSIQQLEAYLDYALRKQGMTPKRQKDFHFAFTIFLQTKTKRGYKKGSVVSLNIFNQFSEGKNRINISSLSIYNIINSLANSNGYSPIPYEDSKFTWLFRNCFGGGMTTTILLTLSQYQKIPKNKEYLELCRKAMTIENRGSVQQPNTTFNLQNILSRLEQINKLQFDKHKQKRMDIIEKHKQTIYHNEFISPNQFSPKNKRNQFKFLKKEQDSRVSLSIQNMKRLIFNYNPQSQNEKLDYYEQKRMIRLKLFDQEFKQRMESKNPQLLTSNQKRVIQAQIFQNEQLFQKQRQCYLSSVRQLQKQLSLYKQLAESMLGKQKIKLIEQNSQFCNFTRTYKIPQFSFKNGIIRINPLKSNEERQKIRKKFHSHPLLSKGSTQKRSNLIKYQIWANDNEDIKPQQKSFFSPYLTQRTPKSGDKNSWKTRKGRNTNTQGNQYMLVAAIQNNRQASKQKMSRSWSKKFR